MVEELPDLVLDRVGMNQKEMNGHERQMRNFKRGYMFHNVCKRRKFKVSGIDGIGIVKALVLLVLWWCFILGLLLNKYTKGFFSICITLMFLPFVQC